MFGLNGGYLIGGCVRMPLQDHSHTLSTCCAGWNHTNAAVLAHKTISLYEYRMSMNDDSIFIINSIRMEKKIIIVSPYAWPIAHRWRQTDDQLTMIHPMYSICSYLDCRLSRSSQCESCRTNPSPGLSSWQQFDPISYGKNVINRHDLWRISYEYVQRKPHEFPRYRRRSTSNQPFSEWLEYRRLVPTAIDQ